MRLRVIDAGYVSAVESQAVGYGVLDRFQPGDDPAVILANPTEPYMSIGLHQDVELELDEPFCGSRGITILRRRLGGGAIYIDRDQMIFHVLRPATRILEVSQRHYQAVAEPVVRAYRDLGLNAAHRPPGDICVEGRKIGGLAGAVEGHAVAIAGTFLFDFDANLMAHCLKVPSEAFRATLRASLEARMTTMAKLLPARPSRALVKEHFVARLGESLGAVPVETVPTAGEWMAIAAAADQLASSEWNYRRGRKLVPLGTKLCAGSHLTEASFDMPTGRIRVRLLERDGRVAALDLSTDDGVRDDYLSHLSTRLLGGSLDAPALASAIAGAMEELPQPRPDIAATQLATAIVAARHRDK